MQEYVVDTDTRVQTTGPVFLMKAGVPMALSEERAKAALLYGARPVSGEPQVQVDKTPSDDEIKAGIREAIKDILDSGDELTATGVPKLNQIRATVPEATPQLRDEVWAEFTDSQV